jgi:glycosyltransferase involved in cell wall biosynthesis
MFRQILTGLEAMTEDFVFMAEHDVFVHPSTFDFTPPSSDVFWYNSHNFRIRGDGLAVYFLHKSLSQCCASRELLLEEFRERVRRVEADGWHRNGYEPGTRPIAKGGFSDRTSEYWRSEIASLDVRHDNNFTASRWSQSQFRDKSTCQDWQETTLDLIPGWGPEVAWLGQRTPKPPPPIFHPKPQPTGTRDLSILIPARNEMFLAKTVEDILEHKRGNTEIIIGLDGAWADPQIQDHPDVNIFHSAVSIGQRGMTNQCARLSSAKYVLKADAHCAFDEGFDVKLMADMQDDWTVVPIMRNLWVFDWKCEKCGKRTYQGPTPTKCDGEEGKPCDNTTDFSKVMVWDGKKNPQSWAYCFDSEPHFQYFNEFKKRPEGQGDLTETPSLQGSCFMLTREKYWDLNICDESFGSWGSQGLEVSIRTWTSGGRVLCNHKTWYAHLFRTQGGDFGFPYDNPGSKVEAAKAKARDLFFNNAWEKQVRPISWILERFWPVPGWTQEQLDKLKESDHFVVSHS